MASDAMLGGRLTTLGTQLCSEITRRTLTFPNQTIPRVGSNPVSLSNIYKAGSGRENAFGNFAESQQAILGGVAVPKMTCQDPTQARNTRKHKESAKGSDHGLAP